MGLREDGRVGPAIQELDCLKKTLISFRSVRSNSLVFRSISDGGVGDVVEGQIGWFNPINSLETDCVVEGWDCKTRR